MGQLDSALNRFSDYKNLYGTKFTLFEVNHILFALSGPMRHLGLCIPEGEDANKQAINAKFEEFINSSDVRKLISCEGLLDPNI